MSASHTAGTYTLVGVITGLFAGLIFHQVPLITAAGLAVGAALDYWLMNRIR